MFKRNAVSRIAIGAVTAFAAITATLIPIPVHAQGRGWMMGKSGIMSIPDRTPKKGIDPSDLPDPDSVGAKTYARKCSACHPLPNPASHSANKWDQVIDRMMARAHLRPNWGPGMMRGRGSKTITDRDKALIMDYLKDNALKTLDRSHVKEVTPGYLAYEKVCGQCHEPPDPSTHSSEQWPDVVDDMKNLMAEMDVDPMSTGDEKSILGFLDKNSGR